jgi:hypothetical protein
VRDGKTGLLRQGLEFFVFGAQMVQTLSFAIRNLLILQLKKGWNGGSNPPGDANHIQELPVSGSSFSIDYTKFVMIPHSFFQAYDGDGEVHRAAVSIPPGHTRFLVVHQVCDSIEINPCLFHDAKQC